jgi:leucyl-tRNA synthetase
MPQWAGTCWYTLDSSPAKRQAIFDSEKEKYWMPVGFISEAQSMPCFTCSIAGYGTRCSSTSALYRPTNPTEALQPGNDTCICIRERYRGKGPADKVAEKDGKYYNTETVDEVRQIVAKMSKSLKNVVNRRCNRKIRSRFTAAL